MTPSFPGRFGLLLVCWMPVFAGCNLLPMFTGSHAERPEKDAHAAGVPAKQAFRVSQFVFLADFEIRKDLPIFKDLGLLREQVYRDLRLPASNRDVFVYLFEDKEKYEKFMHAKYTSLPDRRAFFIVQPRSTGGVEDLNVYTYWSSRIQQDLRHELTHALLHSTLKNVPIWLDEGLAEYFELPTGWNGINAEHVEKLREPGVKFDLDRLEKLDNVHQMTPAEYREAWAWVHLMLRSTPQAKQALVSYLQELRTNPYPGPLRPRLAGAFLSLDNVLQTHLADLERQAKRATAANR